MAKLFANSGDPDQTPHSAASDLGLHCLPITLLRVSRKQWAKEEYSRISFSSSLKETHVVGTHYIATDKALFSSEKY